MTILDANISKSFAGGPSFSLAHRVARMCWQFVWLVLAAWTPAPFHAWRCLLLRLFGASLGRGVHVYSSARIWYPPHLVMGHRSCLGPSVDCYCMDKITIGDDVVISQGAHLCSGSHDIGSESFQLITKPITIGNRAWIAAGAFVGPGVHVGEGAVLSARAAAFSDLDDWMVYRGNPASPIKRRILRR